MIIIVVSILFVALELSQASSKVTKNFISVLQAIFRFLRIFLLIRKVTFNFYMSKRHKHLRKSKKLETLKRLLKKFLNFWEN
jgi:aminopeptidase C